MPYVKELSSEGTVIAGWLDQAEDWDQIQQLGLQISVEFINTHTFIPNSLGMNDILQN